MNFDIAFKQFKETYSATPRVIEIIENQFGGDEITVLFYDKHDKTPPLDLLVWEGYEVDYRGMFELKNTWEQLFDLQVLDSPESWETEVMGSKFYYSISKQIAEYELGLL